MSSEPSGLAWLAGLVRNGLVRTREATAALLAQRPGLDAAVLMVVLAFVVKNITTASAAALFASEDFQLGTGTLVSRYLSGMVLQFFTFMIIAGLADWIGRKMGGKGNLQRLTTAVAYALLLQAFLEPLFLGLLIAGGGDPKTMPPTVGLLIILLGGYYIWILGSAIAEAHGFRRTFPVAGAVAGLGFLFILILPLFGVQMTV